MDKLKPCPFCGGEIDGPNFVQCNYGKKIITLGLTCKNAKPGSSSGQILQKIRTRKLERHGTGG